jgi:hypothetical protein
VALDQNDGAIVYRLDILTSVVNRSRVYEAQNRVFMTTLASRMAHGQAHLANLTTDPHVNGTGLGEFGIEKRHSPENA